MLNIKYLKIMFLKILQLRTLRLHLNIISFKMEKKKKKSKIFEKCSFRKEIIVFEIGSSIEEFLLHRLEDFQA